jgi:hypothetical protein
MGVEMQIEGVSHGEKAEGKIKNEKRKRDPAWKCHFKRRRTRSKR